MKTTTILGLCLAVCACETTDRPSAGVTHHGEAAAINPQQATWSKPRPIAACLPPTLQECRSPMWRRSRCGKLQMARMRVDPQAECNVLLGNAAQALSQFLPTREVVAPQVVSSTGVVSQASNLGGNDCIAAPGHTCARYQPYSNQGHYARGFASTSYGMSAKAMSFLPLDNTSEEAAQYRFFAAMREGFYAGNGNTVASCQEYVYEKYYDYTLFELEAAKTGNQPRSFVDAAFSYSDLRSSIGTRSILGIPLAGRDGTPFTDGIEFPANQKKNAFFEVELTGPGVEEHPVELPCLQRDAVSAVSVHLNDDSLAALLRQDPRHNESFDWHRSMNEALMEAQVLDEELYYLDSLKRDFLGLLARRERIKRSFFDMLAAAARAVDQTIEVNLNPLDDIIDPITLLGLLPAMDEAGIDVLAAGGALPGANAFTSVPPMDFSVLTPVGATQLQPRLQSIADRVCMAIDPMDAPSTAAMYLTAFALVDDAIERALTLARARGCLDVDNPYSPCDWSPELFTARAAGLFAQEREQDFEACMAYTANDFAKLNGKEFRVDGEIICPAQDFRQSPTKVEEYISCVDAWRQATIAKIESTQGSILDPATGKLRIGRTGADVFDLGSDLLGGTLDYAAGWSVVGFEGAEDVHALSLSLDGHVNASAHLFGLHAALVTGGVKVNTEQVDVDLVVLTEDIYSEPPEQHFEATKIHSVQDARGFPATFIQSSMIVPVLAIPVTVRGGVTGEAGLNYGATALSQNNPVDRQFITLVEPYMSASAFVSASVDAVIIEVGVKGSVTVIRLGLPVAAGVRIHLPVNEQDMQLVVSSQGDMTLNMLSGRVAVFGEIDTFVWSESVEIPLFSWGGFNNSANLYKMSYSVPVEPLFWLANENPY